MESAGRQKIEKYVGNYNLLPMNLTLLYALQLYSKIRKKQKWYNLDQLSPFPPHGVPKKGRFAVPGTGAFGRMQFYNIPGSEILEIFCGPPRL